MNVNLNYLTTMYEKDIRIHTVFTSHGAGKVTYHYYLFSANIVGIKSGGHSKMTDTCAAENSKTACLGIN